jgi:hypothetical protein
MEGGVLTVPSRWIWIFWNWLAAMAARGWKREDCGGRAAVALEPVATTLLKVGLVRLWLWLSRLISRKSISSSGAKLARCKTPNQRAVEVLRAPFSSGHSQKL